MQRGTYEDGGGARAATVLEIDGPRREVRWNEASPTPHAGDADGRRKTAIVGLRLAMPLAALLWALVAAALWSILR